MQDHILTVLIRDALEPDGRKPKGEVTQRLIEQVDPTGDGGVAHMVPEVVEQMVHQDPALEFFGDDVVDVPGVTEGLALTHRITTAEIANDRLELDPNLSLLASAAADLGGLHRATDGWPLYLHTFRDPHGGRSENLLLSRHLTGPTGWLSHLSPGDLVTCRAEGGFLHIEKVPDSNEMTGPSPLTLTDRQREGLDRALDEYRHGDPVPVDIGQLALHGLLDGWLDLGSDPSDHPVPFGDLLEAAGLELDGHQAADPDQWDGYRRITTLITRTVAHHHHGSDHLPVITAVIDEYDRWRSDRSEPPAAAPFKRLHRDPEAVFCLEDELLRSSWGHRDDLRAFLDAVELPAGRSAAAVWSLRAAAAEACGDIDAFVAATDSALAVDPMWMPAVECRYRAESNRGHVSEALRLLSVVRTADDAELTNLRALDRELHPSVGRNEPCPCGSGRKFKQCHLGRTEMTPVTRAWWLLVRAREHQEQFGDPHLDLALGEGERSTMDFAADQISEAGLFAGGGLAAWLATYRPLLDPADVALAEDFLARQRPGVYRVEEIAGDQMTLSAWNHPDDGLINAVLRRGSYDLDVGDLVWLRLLPVGDSWWPGLIWVLLDDAEADVLAEVDATTPEGATITFRLITDIDQLPELTDRGRPVVFSLTTWDTGATSEEVETFAGRLATPTEHATTWQLSGDDVDTGYLMLFKSGDDDSATLLATARSMSDREMLIREIEDAFPTAEMLTDVVHPWRLREAIELYEQTRMRAAGEYDESLDEE